MTHLKTGFVAAVAILPMLASAQLASTPQSFVEHQRKQERERALREQNECTVDQRPQAAPPAPAQRIPEAESPCFRIDRVRLIGEQSESFEWAVADLSGPDGNDSPIGRCLGTAGVNVVLARAQQAAIARGYVTPRVLAAPQDLSTGTLTLSLVPGRIAAIRTTADSSSTLLGSFDLLTTAIPARPGDLLNLRDIEQGLENLERAPTAEADIQIGWAVPWVAGQSGAELHAGMDYGHVGGRSTADLLGRSLTGAVIGVRGQWSKLSYDVFVGAPVSKPEGYRTVKVTLGFNVNASV